MKYRSVSTAIWTDDAILELSPEQKLVLLYLHTNPYASACGIYKMQVKTMAFQLGFQQDAFESALRGLCATAPDFVAMDWQTMEIGLLQYPKQTLIQASPGTMKYVQNEITNVKSQHLLRELISRNSATISKPYLSQLRRLQMEVINGGQNNGDVLQLPESQHDDGEKEKEKEKEKEREKERARAREENPLSPVSQNFDDASEKRASESIEKLTAYFRENPARWVELCAEARVKMSKEDFWENTKRWARWNADNYQVFQNPVKALTSGRNNFLSWLGNERIRQASDKAKRPAYADQPAPSPNAMRIHRKTKVS